MSCKGVGRNRIQLTLSTDMRIALHHLARARGLTPASTATMLLRGALDRTISSAEVQHQIKQHVAQRTRADWELDTTTNHIIESHYAKEKATLAEIQSRTDDPARQ